MSTRLVIGVMDEQAGACMPQEARVEVMRALRWADDVRSLAPAKNGGVPLLLETVRSENMLDRVVYLNPTGNLDTLPFQERAICARLNIEVLFGVGHHDQS